MQCWHSAVHAHTITSNNSIIYMHDCIFHYPSSDGMSHSGVFITCMSEIEGVKVEGGVDFFQTVKAARAQGAQMVNTSVS